MSTVKGLKPVLDDLDKKIIHHVCSGVFSYTDLGQRCGVGRNTIYRRIKKLENNGIIKKKVMAIPDFTKLNLSAIGVMMDVPLVDMDQTIDFLKTQPHVKFLWKSYGSHNVSTLIVCNKGEEGETIFNLRAILEKMKVNVQKFEASISFTWEKVDLTPF